MIPPRWRKVLRDILENRARTALIVLTMAAGVFAIGTIGAAALSMQRQFPEEYWAIRPAHLVFTTSPFEVDLAHSIASIRGVEDAEARRNLYVQLLQDRASDTWRTLQLFGIVDFNDQRVDRILPVSGDWPPQKDALLMERGSMEYLALEEGQAITIKTPRGRERTLTISGVAHDLYHMPAFLEGTVYAYITDDTLRWLGESVTYNELYVRVEGDVHDAAGMRLIKEHITNHLEDAGVVVFTTEQPRPDGYPMDYIANTVVLLLILLGGLILLLGACLVINTMSALVAQQARQIAVIKAVGGSARQVLGIYLGMVVVLGALSALIAVPPSIFAARELVDFVGRMLNFASRLESFPAEIIALQAALAVLLPIASALVPVWKSARQPPAPALSEYARGRIWSGVRSVDRLLRGLRGVTRLELLALRNPFRNGSRLVFSLIMLSLAGGSFITVVNLQTALKSTVETMLGFWKYDFWVILDEPQRVTRLQLEARKVPGVTAVEGWAYEITRRVRPDGSESNPIFYFGTPADSKLIEPTVMEGRWLAVDAPNEMVVGVGLLAAEPDLAVGKDIVLKVQGQEQDFHIVGVVQQLGNQTVGYITYSSLDTFNRMAHQENHANMAVVQTLARTTGERRTLGSAVERAYEDAGIRVSAVAQMDDERLEIYAAFDVLIALLMVMVLLLSIVGGMGLTGTMSLNVLERSREIGVIRAFGGSNRSVFRLVALEGVAIGVMSWFLSLLLAIPLTDLFCRLVGQSAMSVALDYRYSAVGALSWLALVILLAALSSAAPAANAVRLTVREVLAYE